VGSGALALIEAIPSDAIWLNDVLEGIWVSVVVDAWVAPPAPVIATAIPVAPAMTMLSPAMTFRPFLHF
jgi:hypothetical protein